MIAHHRENTEMRHLRQSDQSMLVSQKRASGAAIEKETLNSDLMIL